MIIVVAASVVVKALQLLLYSEIYCTNKTSNTMQLPTHLTVCQEFKLKIQRTVAGDQ